MEWRHQVLDNLESGRGRVSKEHIDRVRSEIGSSVRYRPEQVSAAALRRNQRPRTVLARLSNRTNDRCLHSQGTNRTTYDVEGKVSANPQTIILLSFNDALTKNPDNCHRPLLQRLHQQQAKPVIRSQSLASWAIFSENPEMRKTNVLLRKTLVLAGVEDGIRTRDIRNHNPTL